MKKNIGGMERIIRIVAGVGMLSLVFTGPETNWGYLGLIPLVTGMIAWCPLYQILGFSTCKSCS